MSSKYVLIHIGFIIIKGSVRGYLFLGNGLVLPCQLFVIVSLFIYHICYYNFPSTTIFIISSFVISYFLAIGSIAVFTCAI